MSRIGRQPITIPSGVEVKIEKDLIVIKGPRGKLSRHLHPLLKVVKIDNTLKVDIKDKDDKKAKALWGLFRSLLNNMVLGVRQGYEKRLIVEGVGYRVTAEADKLTLNIGYSHPVMFQLPESVEAKVDKNIIIIAGPDKELVGNISSKIRALRPPEPYKGKGIRYEHEVIRRKVGKALKASGGET